MNKYIIILIVLFLLIWKKTSKNPDGLTAEQIDAIKDNAVSNGSVYDDEIVEEIKPLPKPNLAINLVSPVQTSVSNPLNSVTSSNPLTTTTPSNPTNPKPSKNTDLIKHVEYDNVL